MLDPRTVSGYSKNVVFPAGYLVFDPKDANGNLTGEIYLADTPGFTVNVTSDSLEDYDADGPLNEQNFDHPTSVKRSANVEVKDMSSETAEMFYIADSTTKTTTAGPVTAKPINGGNGVLQGRWYQLGVDTTHPTGIRAIDTVVINEGVTPQTVDADYQLDTELGRIYIVPGGGIADGTVLTSDYNTTAVSWEQIASNSLGAKEGTLRFIAHNARGINRDAFFASVVMKPNGDAVWKSRDAVQKFAFAVSIQKPTDGTPAMYINGRAA